MCGCHIQLKILTRKPNFFLKLEFLVGQENEDFDIWTSLDYI